MRELRLAIGDPGSFVKRRKVGDRVSGMEYESLQSWGARAVAELIARDYGVVVSEEVIS